jgi:hypothetical protein
MPKLKNTVFFYIKCATGLNSREAPEISPAIPLQLSERLSKISDECRLLCYK